MKWMRVIGGWLWQHREQILFVDHFVILAIGSIGVASVIFASRSFYLQAKIYEEQSFNREQGALSLAWHTVADANNTPSEIGQSNAILFLLTRGALGGKITLNRTQLTIHQTIRDRQMYVDLSESSICGTNLYLNVALGSNVNLRFALIKATKISGRLIQTYAMGADFQSSSFDNVRAPRMAFIAANLRNAVFMGGSFEKADFQGADMRGVETYRGYSGAGDVYDDQVIFVPGSVADGYYSEDSEYPAIFSKDSNLSPLERDHDVIDTVYLVDFRGAQFLKTDIRGADLSNSTISQKQVDEACADAATKLPNGVRVNNYCIPEDWVLVRRELAQSKTYEGRTKAMEECDTASKNPIWR
jgi:uncharacterized protein YjbI with pentapeptide repeats